RAWAALAGRREDVSPANLLRIMREANITDPVAPDAPAQLRNAIGDGFVRTAQTHYQYQGTQRLPVIATLFGPRITPDTSMTRGLVHAAILERREVPATEVAYVLGHDRAAAHLARDLHAFPDLRSALNIARYTMRQELRAASSSTDANTNNNKKPPPEDL